MEEIKQAFKKGFVKEAMSSHIDDIAQGISKVNKQALDTTSSKSFLNVLKNKLSNFGTSSTGKNLGQTISQTPGQISEGVPFTPSINQVAKSSTGDLSKFPADVSSYAKNSPTVEKVKKTILTEIK